MQAKNLGILIYLKVVLIPQARMFMVVFVDSLIEKMENKNSNGIGLSTIQIMKPIVISYVSIFETLWLSQRMSRYQDNIAKYGSLSRSLLSLNFLCLLKDLSPFLTCKILFGSTMDLTHLLVLQRL